MTRSHGFSALALASVLALPLSAATGQPPPPAPPTGPAAPLEYAVKFVCGPNGPAVTSTLTAAGNYYTAVNVHNPGPPQEFTYKVALAGFGAAGRMTPFQPYVTLRYDEALDFDCSWIKRRLAISGIPVPAFATGFLVIQAHRELDVVAVYTAAPNNTNQVSTMHTERVPVRRVQ